MELSSLKDIWKQTLLVIRKQLEKSEFLTWFNQTAIVSLDDETGDCKIGVPTIMFVDNLSGKYSDIICQAIEEVTEIEKISLTFEVITEIEKNHKVAVDVSALVKKEDTKKSTVKEVHLAEGVESKILSPKYTLSNYVVGGENQLAFAAAQAVARKPGHKYNPLFVYGGVGLGKTHLMQAVGNEVIKNFPKYKVCYVTSEQITNEIVQAIRSFKTNELRSKYRNVDLLLVDDIQFIAHKDKTQEEFFHTFNELYEHGKQIILSADRPPQELDQIEPRLRSRFEMGMSVDVQFPDFETRFAILQQKAKESEIIIPNDVLEFVAMNVHHSVRELEGILNQIIAQYELQQISPTVDSVAKLMKKTHKRQTLVGNSKMDGYTFESEKTPEDIIEIVCNNFKITDKQVKSESRKKHVLMARQLIMYLLKEAMDMTYEEIGDLFGGKEHSTVLHSCKKIKELMDTDPRVRKEVNQLLGMI